VRDLTGRVQPTAAQSVTLLSPLLDFAFDAGRDCPARPTLGEELAHQAWLIALVTELFKGAHSPCDVVGNGVVVGVATWSQTKLPDLLALGLSTFVSAACGRVLE
jgi:hypothetical protein